jgi:hypothetical protein
MPPTHDITLNGVAYTVVPGSYRKRNAPAAAAVNPRDVRRITLGPFGGGQRQAVQRAGSDAGWDSVGVAPCYNSQGVEPFPHLMQFTDALLDTPSTTQRAYAQIAGSHAYIGLGRRIYKSVALSAGSWAAFTAVADLGAGFTISGLAYYQDDLLVMLSTGQDIRKLNTATNALSVWRTGEKGVTGVGYKGQLVYAPRVANAQEELRLSGTKWNGNAVTHLRYLDSPIVNMALFNGKVAIATKSSLYLMGGQAYPGEADDPAVTADTSKAPAWLGDPEPLMTHGTFAADDDFSFLCSYRGRLYTWLAGRVAEFDDSTEQGRWLRVGPEGVVCHGGCVAGDWLVVNITSRYGNHEVWGFDGAGWWLLAQRTPPFAALIWPCPVGGAGTWDLLAFRSGSTIYDLLRLKWRSTTNHTYPGAGAWTSSLLDAGDPTRDKAWRAVGAAFAQPANRGKSDSVDTVTVALEYSTDNGASWVTAASLVSASAATRAFTLQSAFSPAAIPTSRHLQLRVAWSSVVDWAPVLVDVWAEYETLDNAPSRRRWELVIAAGDRTIGRDGSVGSLTGRQKITALWDGWGLAAPLALEDIDHDTDPTTYTVRIEEIEEIVAKPSDAARWGESRVALTLGEV